MEGMGMLIGYLALMGGFIYFLMIRPEKKRRKEFDTMVGALKVNDEIMTRGGIMGKVVAVKDDYIILESGPDKARIKLAKTSVGMRLDNTAE